MMQIIFKKNRQQVLFREILLWGFFSFLMERTICQLVNTNWSILKMHKYYH